MEVYSSEQEQVEALKKWWKENGKAIVVGAVLGLGGVFGWRYWNEYRDHRAAEASARYEMFLQALRAGQTETVGQIGQDLVSAYDDTPYAALGAMGQARQAVADGDLATAARHLRWALDHAVDPGFAHVARLRLARVVVAQGQPEAALKLIDGVAAGSFQPAYDEARGDILLAQGRIDAARSAYGTSLAALPPDASSRELLQMKLDDLATPANP